MSNAHRARLTIVAALAALAVLVPAAGAQSAPAHIYWDNTQIPDIARGTLDGNAANTNQAFIPGLRLQHGIGLATDRQYLYWTDLGNIARANLDGTGIERSFLPLSDDTANWVVTDNRHLYFANEATIYGIGRANLDGTGLNQKLIQPPTNNLIRGLAVDSEHVYWIGQTGVGRANLDGTGVDPSFITGISGGSGLAVDGQHIYWSVATNGSIGRANLDGTGVDASFISGLWQQGLVSNTGVRGLAVDFEHIYWVNYYSCNYRVTPNRCGGGGIGRANLDGTGVNETFLTASPSAGPGCGSSPGVRCGPTTVALDQPSEPACLRTQSMPLPPPGGAVFWRPPDPGTSANTVIIPPGTTWTPDGPCTGIATGAQQVMTSPSSISVAPGGAVSLSDATHGLTSAWGGQTTPSGGPAPVLFPGRADWQTTAATVVEPQTLLQTSGGCPGCEFPDDASIAPIAADPDVAYRQDLSDAVLDGATLSGDFGGWDFSGAQLPGATLDGTGVSGTDFSGADLRGAHLTSLAPSVPPDLSGVRIGALGGACTTFSSSDLTGTGLTPVKADALVPGCASSPLFPNTTVPMSAVGLLAATYDANVDLSDAQILVTAGNSDALRGANLTGIHLAGASFEGFPADLESTTFDNASLQGTHMDLADLRGATFRGAQANSASFTHALLSGTDQNPTTGAQFTGAQTDLTNADFIGADISNASFQNATLSEAVFDQTLAVSTNFNSVIATGTRFDNAHIYGDGGAFDGAKELRGASFVGAVLAGSVSGQGGFDFTNADLTGAKFENAQCVACNFTQATLTNVTATGAYMPGAQFTTAIVQSASFDQAWLYCGYGSDSGCGPAGALQWPLALGSQEDYGPVPFTTTTLTQTAWEDVTVCPDGTTPNPSSGCEGKMTPNGVLSVPVTCSAVALDACTTRTSTLLDNSGDPPATPPGPAPVAVVPAAPPAWSTPNWPTTPPTNPPTRGYYTALDDGTVRLVTPGIPATVVAGTAGARCAGPTQPCGDGGPATEALLDTPSGLAVGLNGSVFIADAALHRVRRIDPAGRITTVAGSGQSCASPTAACGDRGPAEDAALADPSGVWVSPSGELFIADGTRGVRRVGLDGVITTVPTDVAGAAGPYDIVSVAGDAAGNLWAAANDPDYILRVDLTSGTTTVAVGTGTSGYNGNTNSFGLANGDQVQVNKPTSLSVAIDGDVVFADTGNNLIRAYVPTEDTVINDIAGLIGSDGKPQGGPSDDGDYADATKLNAPAAVTVTRGALYVIADTGNFRLRQVGPPPPATDLGEPGPEPPPHRGGPSVTPPRSVPPVVRPPRRPDSRFKVGRVKVRRDGTVVAAIKVRGPGKLRALVTTRRNGHRRPFARGEQRVRRAATVRLRAKPNARGARLVRRDPRGLVLRLAVTFTPQGGASRSVRVRGLRLPAV